MRARLLGLANGIVAAKPLDGVSYEESNDTIL
jgi:hypothetical protein